MEKDTRERLQTAAGKAELAVEVKKLKQKHKQQQQQVKQLRGKQRKRAEMRLVFEEFDTDGSALLDKGELGMLLKALCVPVQQNQVEYYMNVMDADNSGDLDFSEFANWYMKELPKIQQKRGAAGVAQQFKLGSIRAFGAVTGRNVEQEAVRLIIQRDIDKAINEARIQGGESPLEKTNAMDEVAEMEQQQAEEQLKKDKENHPKEKLKKIQTSLSTGVKVLIDIHTYNQHAFNLSYAVDVVVGFVEQGQSQEEEGISSSGSNIRGRVFITK